MEAYTYRNNLVVRDRQKAVASLSIAQQTNFYTKDYMLQTLSGNGFMNSGWSELWRGCFLKGIKSMIDKNELLTYNPTDYISI